MGIQGLTTFIDAHSHLLTDFELHDTKVVIDGNNLFHFLYYHFNIGCQFGGDYDVYAKGVRFYFRRLQECNIEPYVVFDGAYPQDNRKLKTSLKRANDKLQAARRLSKGEVANVLPLLASETFHSVLSELNVKHFTCDFEADNQLNALANELQCPVMSNDSDFYIYDVHKGFILFDYIHLEKHTKLGPADKVVNYIKVQIYYLDGFLKNFSGITREKIPLFASLLGNDYISREDLQPFYAETKVSKSSTKQSKAPKRFGLISSLLNWLESVDTVSNAMTHVLQCFKAEKRDSVQKRLELSVNEYLSHVDHPLQFDCHNVVCLSPSDVKIGESGTIGGKMLPKWILTNCEHGLVSVSCLNVVVSNRLILPPQVEDMKSCSSHACSRKLRQIIYTLLISSDQGHVCPFITEYDRGDGSVRKIEVPILEPSEEILCRTTLHTTPQMSATERLQTLLRYLSVSESTHVRILELVGEDRILPYLAVMYWIENANPLVMDIHFKSLVLCFLKNKEEADSQLVDGVAEETHNGGNNGNTALQSKGPMEKLRTFCDRQKISIYNSSITHTFAQYQSCWQAVVYLNQLLFFPLKNPNPSSFINGTFLYNMSRNLLNRTCPDLYIQELLGKGSDLHGKFQEVVQCVTESLSSKDRLLLNVGKGAKKKSKKRRTGAADKSKVQESMSSNENSSNEESDATGAAKELRILCSTNNKFDLLCAES